jgi:diguanylate cyclase (GGDEF)-like protein/putative nucleotidyltransferase with HDIG domain
MNQEPQKNEPQWKDIYTTLKFLVLIICIIPVLQKIFSIAEDDELVFFNIAKMVIFFVIILITAIFWLVINYKFKDKRWNVVFEIAVMYGVCLLCYYSTGIYLSNYKFVFALVILLYAIDYGARQSMAVAIASGATIVISDIIVAPLSMRSQCFQSNILLMAAFCITAYTIGYYSDKDRKQIRELSDAVNRDSLTKLYNHRYFYDFMHKELENSFEGKKQYIIIMDIDYFKAYNDNLGHPKGDVALRNIAHISRSIFDDDHIFRYGGEEFSLYMIAENDDQAFKKADKLRRAIEDFDFPGEEMQPGNNLTVSIGVAVKKDTGDTVADWIERADNALYKAKAFQKNRVQMYSSVYDRFDEINLTDENEQITSIKTLLSVINTRDRYTYNHTDRVVHFCEAFAKHIRLSEGDLRNLLYSAYLHDIGKINIPQEILISEKKLTDEEWKMMKRHPSDGADIARKIKNFGVIANIIHQHHEKYDGSGYPCGKKGEDILYLARVLTLADSFDAMTAKRPYQKSKTFKEAFAEIRRCKGTHFDPLISEQFIAAIKESYLQPSQKSSSIETTEPTSTTE